MQLHKIRVNPLIDHFYNSHENCGVWCQNFNEGHIQTVVLKDQSSYDALKSIFVKYANSASKFYVAASSQANESLNSLIASRAFKSRCLCKTESCDYRVALCVLTENDGDIALLVTKKKFGLDTTVFMFNYCSKLDKLRKVKSENKITKKYKL